MELAIVAQGTANLSPAELAVVRQQSIGRFSSVLRPQLLKHSDEQTLAAAVALDRAIQSISSSNESIHFGDWAVVSATRYLGRAAFGAVIDKYKIDGPWGVSVQVIPHTSPHALASTLSLALGSHGPCLGAGAAPGEQLQALFTAVTLLARAEVGGTWLAISGWSDDPSSPSDDVGHSRCEAVVLGLVPKHVALVHQICPSGRIAVGPAAHRHSAKHSRQLLPTDLAHWFVRRPLSGEAVANLSSGGIELQIEFFDVPQVPAGPPAPHFQSETSGIAHHKLGARRLMPDA
jgi:hypothetical protein